MNCFHSIDSFSDVTAVIRESSDNITYNILISDADRIGSYIKKRSLVFLLCSNCVESVAGYLGFLRSSVVPVLINKTVDAIFFNNLLQTYKPSYVFLPKNTPQLRLEGTEIFSYGLYTLFKTNYSMDVSIHDELALLMMTSGSTGSPKLVRQSYNNLRNNAASISKYLAITGTDRPITTMPMAYTYGLSIINSHLLNGASIILTNSTVLERCFWETLNNNDATTFGGVPYTYEMLDKLRFGNMHLPSLKYLTQAGGKLTNELSEKFVEICVDKKIKFFTMYGQTEATARMSYLPWEYAHSKRGSIGVPIHGGSFRLEGDNGVIILDNYKPGELIFLGDNVALGYAETPQDLSKGDDNKGILHTGDIAIRDSDGFYFLVGRKTRFLKLFGNRINLDDIEQIIKATICDCSCVGEDDNLTIYVTKNDAYDQISRILTRQIGINKTGFSIVHIDKLPRNEFGKIRYSALT